MAGEEARQENCFGCKKIRERERERERERDANIVVGRSLFLVDFAGLKEKQML